MVGKGYTTCEDCGRLLREVDGPVCPECLAKRESPLPPPTKGFSYDPPEEFSEKVIINYRQEEDDE